MRIIREGLDSDIRGAQTRVRVISGSFRAGNPIRREAERVHDIRAKQVSVSDSKGLPQTHGRRVQRVEWVVDGQVIGRGVKDLVGEITDEYRIVRAALIVKTGNALVIICGQWNPVPDCPARILGEIHSLRKLQ